MNYRSLALIGYTFMDNILCRIQNLAAEPHCKLLVRGGYSGESLSLLGYISEISSHIIYVYKLECPHSRSNLIVFM